MAARPWVREYFKRLEASIANDEIRDERGLSTTVEIPLSGWKSARTLLQALEYKKDHVSAGHPIQLGASKHKVDFLLGDEVNRWMLDLKEPAAKCTHRGF